MTPPYSEDPRKHAAPSAARLERFRFAGMLCKRLQQQRSARRRSSAEVIVVDELF
jgi:hypothetical protein